MTSYIDPWAMQHTLMKSSDQTLPSSPELNKGVLLYSALNLEEGSETVLGLASALNRLVTEGAMNEKLMKQLKVLSNHLEEAGTQMHEHSLAVRSELEEMPDDFRAELKRDEVIVMADGTTDLAVTNCGFALSLGLNGSECYNEVASSNLSKRNPDTGRIDKTPDGKWIKGVSYRAPSLEKVVFKD